MRHVSRVLSNIAKHRSRILYSTVSFLLIGIFLLNATPAGAISATKRQHYARLFIEFIDDPCDPPASDSAGGGENDAAGGTSKENIKTAFKYFVEQHGLTPVQSAGIVGNLRAESAVLPTRQEGKGTGYIATAPINGVGFGIAQWTYNSRQAPLVKLAHDRGVAVNTLGVQLDYLWQELTHGYSYVLDDLKKATTITEAADVILQRFEVPRDRGASVTKFRASLAQQVYDDNLQFLDPNAIPVNSGTGTVDTTNSCASVDEGGSGTVDGKTCKDLGKKSDGGNDNPYLCDSSEVKCAAGTDAGTDIGYNRADHYKIRKCKVGGIIVNALLSGNLQSLLNQAKAEGKKFTGGGFRTMQGQLDTRRANRCFPVDHIGSKDSQGIYAKSNLEANRARTPPKVGGCGTLTATPGYSNHQMGLAIDFSYNGSLIRSKGSAGYKWLVANAGKYGLKDEIADQEPWHWSVTGG